MFKLFWKQWSSPHPEGIEVETGTYGFAVTNKAEIKNVRFNGNKIIDSISLADPLPFGLKERFEDAYISLEEENFGTMAGLRYNLSSERGINWTRVFASTNLIKNDSKGDLKIIVTAKKNDLIIEIKTKIKYKTFWGITATIKASEESSIRKSTVDDFRTFKRSEHEPASIFVCESDNVKSLVMATYGNGKTVDKKHLSLSPVIEGTDREVVNSWRAMDNLSNYNTITIRAFEIKNK